MVDSSSKLHFDARWIASTVGMEEYRTGSDSDRVHAGKRLVFGSIEPEAGESGPAIVSHADL